MCNPFVYNCTAIHYPLVIHGAMDKLNEQLGSEVQLGAGARKVLYEHGAKHKDAFDAVLRKERDGDLESLSAGLSDRLQEALKRSGQVDQDGVAYNPARIGGDALKHVLASNPWVPEAGV